MKTTIFVFHPNLKTSTVNRYLSEQAGEVVGVSVRDMYQRYPNFKIDVGEEHRILEESDRIVLQFPMYWFTAPALTKQWLDSVLEYGWAYGGANKLEGKECVIAISTGADASYYSRNQGAKYTVSDLLRPFQAASNMTHMVYAKPFVVGGASNITQGALKQAGQDYVDYLNLTSLPALGDYE